MDTTTPLSADARTGLPALLDAREVAALLGVSERTVRRLARDGVLARVRIGHRTSRYTRRSVLALIDPPDEQRPGGNLASVGVSTDDGRAGEHHTGLQLKHGDTR